MLHTETITLKATTQHAINYQAGFLAGATRTVRARKLPVDLDVRVSEVRRQGLLGRSRCVGVNTYVTVSAYDRRIVDALVATFAGMSE